jgi:outer membrane protein
MKKLTTPFSENSCLRKDKRVFAPLAFLFVFLFAGLLSAQEKPSIPPSPGKAPNPATVTVAVIDMTKAIEDSTEGRTLRDKFKADFEATNTKMSEKGAALERKANEFNQNQANMSDKDREKNRIALEKEITDFEAETEKASQDFRAAVEKAMNPLYARAEQIVSDLAKANNYLIVVENGSANAIIFADPSISVVDITADVTKAVNAKKR